MTSSDRRRVRIGVVGAGFGGYGLTPALRKIEGCDVTAIAASTTQSAEAAALKYGVPRSCLWQELIESSDIDALAIAVPPALQFEIAEAALMAGKPVLAEKPLSNSLEEATRLARLADRTGLANMVDFIFPELLTWKNAKKLIDSKALGRIRHIFLDWRMESFDIRHNKIGWKTADQDGGGVLSHFGVHALYYLEHMIGPIEELSANCRSYPGASGSGDSLANLSLKFQDGASGAVTLCSAALFGSGHCLEVYGETGSLRLTNNGPDPVLGFQLYFGRRDDDGLSLMETEVQPDDLGEDDSRVVPVSRIAGRFIDWINEGVPARPKLRSRLPEILPVDTVCATPPLLRHASG